MPPMLGKIQPRFVRERSRRMIKKQKRKSRASAISMMLLGNDSWELFEGIPKHFSLRTRVRMKFKYSTFGYFWEISQTAFALLVSTLYVMQTYDPTLQTDSFDLAALVVFSFDYLVHFYCCENRLQYVLSFSSLMDLVTILPALLDRISPGENGDNRSNSFPFLRFIRVLRLLRLARLIRATGSRSISAVQKQIHTIVLLITCIVFISAGVFHAVESSGRQPTDPKITFGDALYFLTVTVTTVGYGDIAPLTTYGKIVAAGVIIVSFTVVPTEISRLTQLMALQSPFRKSYQPSVGNPHILVVGHVTEPRSLLDFFRELYHPDRLLEDNAANPLSDPPCVLMGPNEPSEAIVALLDHPMLQNRVTYIKGSVLSEEDLCRVGADAARACFVLVEKSTGKAKEIDAETVLRLLAIRNYNPELEIYTQIVSPTYTDYINEVDADHVLCLDQIKLSVMAKSCLCPGLVTLISNLFRSSTVAAQDICTGWEKEYIEGLALEVYATALPPAYYGLTFSQACDVVYQSSHGEVILLGVYERHAAPQSPKAPSHLGLSTAPTSHLFINPGSTLLMAAGQIVYVLSESKKLTQTASLAEHLKNWLSAGNTIPLPTTKAPVPHKPLRRSSTIGALTKRSQGDVIVDDATHIHNHIIVVTDLDQVAMRTFIQLLRLSRHVPGSAEYHPILFLSWSNKSVTSVCRMLQAYQDVFLMIASGDSKAEFHRANLLDAKRCVLLSDKSAVQHLDGETIDSKTIFHYLAVLSLQAEHGMDTTRGLMPIVELTIPRTMKILDTALKKRTVTSYQVHQFQKKKKAIDSHSPSRKKTMKQLYAENLQSIGSLIKLRKQIQERRSVIRREQETARKAYFDSNGSSLLPFFAAGYGFSDDIFDNMLCQSYFTPGLIRFIYELLFSEEGQTSRSFRATTTSSFSSTSAIRDDHPKHHVPDELIDANVEEEEEEEQVVVSSLTQLPVPSAFVSKTFGELFVHWITTLDMVAIGLYRGSGVPFTLPYVVTGPASETVLVKDDLVYVLAQPHALIPIELTEVRPHEVHVTLAPLKSTKHHQQKQDDSQQKPRMRLNDHPIHKTVQELVLKTTR